MSSNKIVLQLTDYQDMCEKKALQRFNEACLAEAIALKAASEAKDVHLNAALMRVRAQKDFMDVYARNRS